MWLLKNQFSGGPHGGNNWRAGPGTGSRMDHAASMGQADTEKKINVRATRQTFRLATEGGSRGPAPVGAEGVLLDAGTLGGNRRHPAKFEQSETLVV